MEEHIRRALLDKAKNSPLPTGRGICCLLGIHNGRILGRETDDWGDMWEVSKCRGCGKVWITKHR